MWIGNLDENFLELVRGKGEGSARGDRAFEGYFIGDGRIVVGFFLERIGDS